MEILQELLQNIKPSLPGVAGIVVAVIVLYLIRSFFERKYADNPSRSFHRQMITLLLSLIGLLVIILLLPVSENMRGQLLSLLGILLSAAIALSATTFVGNIMAGLMLRALHNFKPGYFINVGDIFGRVSEQGMFHVEVQMPDRDLVTIPNLHLVTNPVKVIQNSGTFIYADVSLGYDIPRRTVRKLLEEAAEGAELTEAFVHITKLGDFSISYRVYGFLEDVKKVISAKSRLREMMLDKLHENDVEIVSPTFMNTRAVKEGRFFIPVTRSTSSDDDESVKAAESLIFDKADQAESLENLKKSIASLEEQIELSKKQVDEVQYVGQQEEIKARIKWFEARRDRLKEMLEEKEKEKQDNNK